MWTWTLLALLSALVSPPEAENASPGAREVPIQRPGEPVSLVLDWQAPESCPARRELVEQLRILLPSLPEDVPAKATARLRVEAKVQLEDASLGSPGADPWTAQLRLITAEGTSERRFSATTCSAVAEATVLIVAITLDPVAVAEGISEARDHEPGPQPTSPEPDPEPAPPSITPSTLRSTLGAGDGVDLHDGAARARGRAPRVGLRVFGSGGWGPTRAFHGGIGGSLALFDRLWRWELAAGWSIPRVTRLDDGTGGRFDGWWVGSRGCLVPAVRGVEFPFCPGVEVGMVRGRGVNPTPNPDRASFLWVAPLLGQGIVWAPIERVALGAEVALVVPVTRGNFLIGEQEVQRLPVVGGRIMLGVELRLP